MTEQMQHNEPEHVYAFDPNRLPEAAPSCRMLAAFYNLPLADNVTDEVLGRIATEIAAKSAKLRYLVRVSSRPDVRTPPVPVRGMRIECCVQHIRACLKHAGLEAALTYGANEVRFDFTPDVVVKL